MKKSAPKNAEGNAKTAAEAFPHLQAVWNWKKLFWCHFAAVVLLITWNGGPVREIWDAADAALYYAMNGFAVSGEAVSRAIAFANTNQYDKLATLVLVGVLASYAALGRNARFDWRLAGVFIVGLLMLVTVYGRRKIGIFEYQLRPTPSLVLEPFHDLSLMFPDLRVKTSASTSFPSNHGNACMIFLLLFWTLARKYWGLFTLAILPFFMLPRMFAGAHWLSDLAVGSLSYSLVIFAWVVYTPFLERAITFVHKPFALAFALLKKLVAGKTGKESAIK